MVRAGGLEPPRGYPQRIFVPATAFAALPVRGAARSGEVCGLDYPFAVPPMFTGGLGAARLVSTPSPYGAWLGIAM